MTQETESSMGNTQQAGRLVSLSVFYVCIYLYLYVEVGQVKQSQGSQKRSDACHLGRWIKLR
jgi:hypothetical protein